MATAFNRILLPVDFSINTDVAVAKALELSTAGSCTLHLFHVYRIRFRGISRYLHHLVTGYSVHEINAGIEKANARLSGLKANIEQIRPDINVIKWACFDDAVEKAIAEKAKRLHADMIIVGKYLHHNIFPFLNTVVPSRLASVSGIPVLTTKPGSMNKEIKTIVMPVGNHFPLKKIEALEALRKKSKLEVRLVTFSKDENNPSFSRKSLLNVFRAVKNHLATPVEFEVLYGNNKAMALLKYCHKVNADILIVYPESETRISSWINRHISDLIPADSQMQVLAVQPL
jgi:nucleotide-binding universal stress UspA family protein